MYRLLQFEAIRFAATLRGFVSEIIRVLLRSRVEEVVCKRIVTALQSAGSAAAVLLHIYKQHRALRGYTWRVVGLFWVCVYVLKGGGSRAG